MSHDEQATRCDGRNRGRVARDTAEEPLPNDWIRTYDGAVDDGPTGLLCPDCHTDEAIIEHMARTAEADTIIMLAMRDQAIDDAHGPPPGGRRTDAMMGIPPPGDRDD